MLRPIATLGLAVLLLGSIPSRCEEGARAAADRFGQLLIRGRLHGLRSLLPKEGKVRLKLDRLGPEDGVFGAGQVEAILADFLARGSVGSFELVQAGGEEASHGLVHGRAVVVDRNGRTCRVGLHLAFELEANRWVLREIRETKR